MMRRILALSAAVMMVVAVLGATHAAAQECDPSENPFCKCQRDEDCINRSMPMMAGVCSPGGTCSNKFSPWVPQLTGSVYAFCSAYVNGCSSASLTLSKDGTEVKVAITGPGAATAETCSLEVSVGGSSVEAGTAGRIADTVQGCVHNAPVYFYSTMKAAKNGSASCCSYDWSYRPGSRASR
jgi:hypothetical protein